MVADAPGPINFTMFLTLFGEKLNGLLLLSTQNIRSLIAYAHVSTPGTDPEDVIRNAFGCFDPDATGYIDEEK